MLDKRPPLPVIYCAGHIGPQSNHPRPFGLENYAQSEVFLLTKTKIMVTIVGLEKRINKVKNEEFTVMILQGGIEVVESKTTGKPYLTARKTSIPCTFSDKFAETMVGQSLPGVIERKECVPYEFIIPNTKKKVTLHHTFQYSPKPVTVEEVVG